MSETVSAPAVGSADAALRFPGGELPLPLVKAAEGADGFDTSKLLSTTGKVALDIGFVNTASCASAITYIDGDAGILRYRGYPIEQLAEKSTFIEVSYLLINGELPNKEQLVEFTEQIQRHTMLHEDLKRFYDGFPRNAHPMPVLSSVVNALSAYYPDSLDPAGRRQQLAGVVAVRALGRLDDGQGQFSTGVAQGYICLAHRRGRYCALTARAARRLTGGSSRARPAPRRAAARRASPARRSRAPARPAGWSSSP